MDSTGHAGVKLAPASSTDTTAVLDMLSRCSRQSLYHRFHGYTDGVAYTRALLRDRPGEDNLLAWDHATCIGMATIGRDEGGREHLGVLVEDSWQRHGVGTRLIRALMDTARSRGVTRVHADILGDDQFLLRTLRRVGPLKVAIELGTFSVDLNLAA
jgi:GNAT superfamily N-acetyltransferase